MDEVSKAELRKIMKQQQPDMSHIKPPTETAASKMVKNLKAAANTKADKKPKQRNKS